MTDSIPTLLYAFLCDDVRREVTGKEIIIGAYADEIAVPTFPVELLFGIYMKVFYPQSGKFNAEFRVLGPSDHPLTRPFKAQLVASHSNRSGTVFLGGAPIQVQTIGQLKFQWRIEGKEWETTTRLEVRSGPAKIPEGMVIPNVTTS